MTGLNVRLPAFILLSVASILLLASPLTRLEIPSTPEINEIDRQFLCRVARRTIEQFTQNQTVYSTDYVPESLRQVNASMVVKLRCGGNIIGAGSAGSGPVVHTTIEATLAALTEKKAAQAAHALHGDVLIEMELVGIEVLLGQGTKWLDSEVIARVFAPGIDGISIKSGDESRRASPAELAVKNLPAADAAKRIVESFGRSPETLLISRFRSQHWYQAKNTSSIVSLRRGMKLIEESEVPNLLPMARDALLTHILQRQRPDGLFNYEFEPSVGAYSDGNNAVHQAGLAWALAEFASNSGHEQVSQAARIIIDAHRHLIHELPGVEGPAACVSYPDGRNKLGATAQLLSAMLVHPDKASYHTDANRLARGILWLIQPTGEILSAFPPSRRLTGKHVYPGMAMQALAVFHKMKSLDEIDKAFDRVLGFYRSDFVQSPTAVKAMAMQGAFATMARQLGRDDYLDFSIELATFLVARQFLPVNCASPELVGGIAPQTGDWPGASTAYCLDGWLRVIEAAKRMNEPLRVQHIEAASQRAIRFVLQMQFRHEELFFIDNVEEVRGGVRTSVADNRLRIDSQQYALQSMLSYERVILGRSGQR